MKKLIVALISFLLAGAAADPAQQRITAYFDAFNKDAAAMTAFIREHVAASSLAQRGIPERLEVYGEMKNDLDSLKQVAIVGERATSNERTVVVKATAGTGGTLTFTFRLEPEPPHKILSLGVERGESQGRDAGPIDATARIGAVRKYMDGLEAYGFTGALLIVQDGKTLVAEGYGDADRAKKIANTADTLFDIGSLVKDFTKIAIAQLEAAGKLTTEDPLRRFFSDLPADKGAITIRQLLDHRAGLPIGYAPDAERVTKEELLRRFAREPLLSKPGERYQYSNPGFSLLAAIIEQLSGQSYEAYVKTNIFDRAGMKDTGYVLPKWPAARRAHAYADGVDEGSTFDLDHLPDGNSWSLRGNGGMLSTLADMQRFYSRTWPGLPSGGVTVGGNFTHYFLYRNEPGLMLFLASTDADFPAMPVDDKLTAILRGRDLPIPPSPAKFPALPDGPYKLTNGGSVRVRAGNVTPLDQRALQALRGFDEVPAALNEKALAEAKKTHANAELIGSYPPAALPPGAKTAGPRIAYFTDVRAGEKRMRFAWTEDGKLQRVTNAQVLSSRRFVPVGKDEYAHYDLRRDVVTRMRLLADSKLQVVLGSR